MQLGLGDKENFEAKQLGRIRDIKFKVCYRLYQDERSSF